MGPDYRLLVKNARKMAQQYRLVYGEEIPTAQLVQRLAAVMQEYTQSGYIKNFIFVFYLNFSIDTDRANISANVHL
jgi:20S proteasome alpha/beta subunit